MSALSDNTNITPTPKKDQHGRPSVVFFGSGPVAAASLELLAAWCDIEAVITKPQPVHHREKFPVIAVAESHGLPLLTASNRRELDELMASPSAQAFESRVAILIDYGIIVSRAVIDSFPLGIVNSHFSVLPEWRGADPITFSILSGQEQTGVSLMLLVEAMDEGPLLGYGEYTLPDDITGPALTEHLIKLSDALLQHEIPRYLEDMIKTAPQSVTGRQPSYSRKLTKADGVLDFNKPAAQLEREIRAFTEWPKSRMVLGGRDVVVTKARTYLTNAGLTALPVETSSHQTPVDSTEPAEPGTVRADKAQGTIMVAAADGWLEIVKLKPAGKAEMDARAFLAGNKL